MRKLRVCKLCKKLLSEYNPDDICFHHPDHIHYNKKRIKDQEIKNMTPIGAGRDATHINYMDIQYHGNYQV